MNVAAPWERTPGRLGKVEKRSGHHGANRVVTNILLSSIAAPVPIEPRHGVMEQHRAARSIAAPVPIEPVMGVMEQHRAARQDRTAEIRRAPATESM